MLKVIKSGLFTTIQDGGRFGYRDKGVPVSGVMDIHVFHNANALLENDADAAVLEITMTGPTLQFEKDTYIVMTGADFETTLNNKPISKNKVQKVKAGDILSYGKLLKGFRGYLAIKNGIKSKEVLGSRSQYFPITPKGCISDNTELEYDEYLDFEPKISEFKPNLSLEEIVLKVSKGPEFKLMDDVQLEQLFINKFTVAKEYNRMGYQFEEKIKGHSWSMLTSATLPGTVQLTPSGKLLILMKDGQTTGGYPRILQLKDTAISILAQKKFGDIISFKLG